MSGRMKRMRDAARAWTRLGASFNVPMAAETPDVERLLLETARVASGNGRLLVMAATWLVKYSDYVAKRRLAVLIEEELETCYRPVLGFLLDWAKRHGRMSAARFGEAISRCQPSAIGGPLLDVNRRNKALVELCRSRASALSRKWGCWVEEFVEKDEALRPGEWIGKVNPALAVRAITGGDLVASIAADAAGGLDRFGSESELARRYGASRAAVRAALRKLALAGYVQQLSVGKSRPIVVAS